MHSLMSFFGVLVQLITLLNLLLKFALSLEHFLVQFRFTLLIVIFKRKLCRLLHFFNFLAEIFSKESNLLA